MSDPVRVEITPKTLAQQVLSATAASAKLTFVAGDTVNGHQFDCTGKELLLVKNTATGAGTVTIAGVADQYGRTGAITAYSIPAGEEHCFGMFPPNVFAQTANGKVYVDESAATITLCVIRVP